MEEIAVEVLTEDGAEFPSYGSAEAAGADIRAYIKEPIILEPGMRKLVPTGLKVAIPRGYEIQVRPRSGLALKHGITVLNTPGTIDSDYRGSVGVILINHSNEPFTITPNMRIAQVVLAQVTRAMFTRADDLAETSRGEGGFGHTGTH